MDQQTLHELSNYLVQLKNKEITIYTDNFEFKGKLVELTPTFVHLQRERDLYETASSKRILLIKIVAISESLR